MQKNEVNVVVFDQRLGARHDVAVLLYMHMRICRHCRLAGQLPEERVREYSRIRQNRLFLRCPKCFRLYQRVIQGFPGTDVENRGEDMAVWVEPANDTGVPSISLR